MHFWGRGVRAEQGAKDVKFGRDAALSGVVAMCCA